jgi:hypothetical protein
MMRLILVVGLTVLSIGDVRAEDSKAKVSFKKVVLDTKFRSEGVSVADFNRDGKLDVGAGRVWFAAPDWKMHSIEGPAKEFDPHGYSGSFCNFADDVNGDGWTDQIVVDFPGTPTYWYENPRKAGPDAPGWKRHTIAPVSNNESPTFLDLDGDGRRELVMAVAPKSDQADGPERQMAFLRPGSDPTQPWAITAISVKGAPGTNRYSHGLGVGDINRDGRNDVVVTDGWWEAPADRSKTPWKFHAAKFGAACAQMYIYDYDGDGDNDVFSTSAHDYGIWYHENVGSAGPAGPGAAKRAWKTHEIDRSFSQSHALMLADINGDGLPDFVTGKRWWAHGPKGDKGAGEPAVMVWFELSREKGQARWTPHVFDHDSGIGTQFEVADMNGDKLLDLVTSNKKGTRVFLQARE